MTATTTAQMAITHVIDAYRHAEARAIVTVKELQHTTVPAAAQWFGEDSEATLAVAYFFKQAVWAAEGDVLARVNLRELWLVTIGAMTVAPRN